MSTVARAQHRIPQAKLPCPICANTVTAANLMSHITKVHADAPVPAPRRPHHDPNMKAHWAGWAQEKRRRAPDVMVDRRALVEIEYALFAAGALSPLAW